MIKKIKKGLSLPITGAPEFNKVDTVEVSRVAIVADDYWLMKPSMAVQVGDKVKAGQALFSDKKNEGVVFTAPVAGVVEEINRGDRRVFQSLVIKKEGSDSVTFSNYAGANVESYSAQKLKDLLIESGMWVALRNRPYSYVARPQAKPSSIFVTAMDTNPLALDPMMVITPEMASFKTGLKVLAKMAGVPVHVCVAEMNHVDASDIAGVQVHAFSGPHPAGNVGTHIHFIDAVNEKKSVWHIGYQDVIAFGKLIESGKIYNQRVITLAGPIARNPRVIKTEMGACLCELTKDEYYPFGGHRVVSGSVFNGRSANKGVACYLGRYHNQVTLLEEGHKREFLGWHMPGLNKYSLKNVFAAKLLPNKLFGFNTNTNGSPRSLVPIGSFEDVMPLDIVPTFLLRSLLSKDTEMSTKLGCLELDEEDLSLCTFVDPCKHEFGPVLRSNLETILKEG